MAYHLIISLLKIFCVYALLCTIPCITPSFHIFRSYLALVAALASEADFVFIPEDPAVANWPEKLCKKLEQVSKQSFLELIINPKPLETDLNGL